MKGIIEGEGTEERPYLIEDVYDFLALEEKNGTEEDIKYAKLVNNIDYNDHDKFRNGLRSTDFPNVYGDKKYVCECNYIVLDGNNKEIRNMVFISWYFGQFNNAENKNYLRFYEIKNCIFTNIVFSLCSHNEAYTPNWLSAHKIQNCNISCYNIKSPISPIMPNGMYESTINIKGKSVDKTNLANKKFTKSRINFDNYFITNETTDFLTSYDLDRSYITGKITILSTNGATLPPTRSIFKNSTFINSFIALNVIFKLKDNDTDYSISPTCKTVCFYDSTLAKPKSASSNLIGLPTEQCKSIEKLQDIGFLVIGV